jgi:hypothetical protein
MDEDNKEHLQGVGSVQQYPFIKNCFKPDGLHACWLQIYLNLLESNTTVFIIQIKTGEINIYEFQSSFAV